MAISNHTEIEKRLWAAADELRGDVSSMLSAFQSTLPAKGATFV